MDEESKRRDVLDVFEEAVLQGREVIYVAGYPRSGTTWLTRLLAQCLDSPSLSWSIKNDVRKPRFRDPAVEGLSRRGPFVVRHGHWKARERDLEREKIVVLHRDPRDVAVSCYHYFPFRRDGSSGMEKCVGEMCGERGKILSFVNVNRKGWAGYVETWLRAGAVWIRYEDLLAETDRTMTELIGRLGLPPRPSEKVRRAVADHTFANRKKDKTMRKGIAGDWKTELPLPLAEKLVAHCGNQMRALGYSTELPRPAQPEPTSPVSVPHLKNVQRHVLHGRR